MRGHSAFLTAAHRSISTASHCSHSHGVFLLCSSHVELTSQDGGCSTPPSDAEVFGKPLVEQPVIREKLAQMFAGVETCTQMLYAARRDGATRRAGRRASLRKSTTGRSLLVKRPRRRPTADEAVTQRLPGRLFQMGIEWDLQQGQAGWLVGWHSVMHIHVRVLHSNKIGTERKQYPDTTRLGLP